MNKETEINLIQSILKSMRPLLKEDNGDVNFVELTDDKVLKIRYNENCKTCKFKKQTMFIIEKQIREVVPDLKKMIEVE